MERKNAPFYLSLAGGFLLACAPEINVPIPAPELISTPRSLVRVRDLEIETLRVLQNRYSKEMSILELCDVLPLITNEEIGASGSLDWPTHGPIFNYFKQGHPAIDIAPPYGTPVLTMVWYWQLYNKDGD